MIAATLAARTGAAEIVHPGLPGAGRTVLATLIHELAHVNGATGGADSRAEQALLHCGLGRSIEHATGTDDPKTPYDPTISG